ncbi:MAG: sulfurtransferase TusA family protein [bacterium]
MARPTSSEDPVPHADVHWDAGITGCGELVMELHLRLMPLASGAVLHLVAKDPGAIEDMPAWCRLTGHRLVRADHPHYWIQKKEN